jgi:hypothetical protein
VLIFKHRTGDPPQAQVVQAQVVQARVVCFLDQERRRAGKLFNRRSFYFLRDLYSFFNCSSSSSSAAANNHETPRHLHV